MAMLIDKIVANRQVIAQLSHNVFTTCHCSIQILGWRHHQALLLENADSRTLTVNKSRYYGMIIHIFFARKLQDMDVGLSQFLAV